MSEGNPWARLGNIPTYEKKEDSVPSNEILIIKDQITEMSKLLMGLIGRVEAIERDAMGPIDNLLEIVSPEDLGILTRDSAEPVKITPDVVVVKSGFSAPPPDEMEQIRESQKTNEESIDTLPDEPTEEVLEQKEFGKGYDIAFIMADLVYDYIEQNGAILNNQAKKRIYTPVEVNPSASDKRKLKELIEGGHTKFKANKMDNFRTLYYIGDDYAEEYEKSYGSKSE